MNKSFNTARALATRGYAKLALVPLAVFTTVQAHAQAVGGIEAAVDAVDLSGLATKVGAAALLIVGIALVFKGPAIAKRIIRSV